MENKNFFLIPERIENIKNMSGKYIDLLIDFKNNNTESYEYISNVDDIRELLPKKYIDFGTAINDLGGKLLYIKSGSTGHTFKGVHLLNNNEIDNSKLPYAVKIVAYSKKENYGDMYNINRPENTEILMIRLLSYFVINKQTPHIVLPIATFNTSIKPFINLTKANIVNNKKFEQFIERYEKGEYYENVSILVSEWANGGDLLDYLRKNYKKIKIKEWKTIFFQILSVVAIIQAKYPSFRHNDMKGNNLLIHTTDINNKKYVYKINNQKYIIPNIGFRIKLWDFDFACIPNIVNNSKVSADWTDKINIGPVQNRYYDIHFFFNTLSKKGFFPELFTADEIPEKVKSFIKRIVPEKYSTGKYVTEKGRILVNDEYVTPDHILKNDSFFKCFRK
jgi:serine/threonine protein kinase